MDSSVIHGVDRQLSRYGWSNEWERAERRLALLEEFADPATFGRLETIGVRPGWSCLEVAAGSGSVARWLRERVGADGRVVATDLEPRLLEGLKGSGVEVVRHDVRKEPLPQNFDLVHARALLMHLPEREQVLDALVGALAPGGWILLEEPDLYSITALGSHPYRTTWETLCSSIAKTAGMSTTWGRRLPEELMSRGLTDVGATAYTTFFAGGSRVAEWVALTWQQAIEQVSLTREQADSVNEAQQQLENPRCWFMLPAIVAAWARSSPSA